MKKIFSLLIMSIPVMMFAQSLDRQVLGSSGGDNTSGNLEMSYTVGETAVQTYSSGTIVLTQGFQQPDQKAVGIEDLNSGLSIKAYPNPTMDQVVLEFTSSSELELNVTVYNALGQTTSVPMERVTVKGTTKQVLDMSKQAAGNYFVEMKNSDGSFHKTITIQKVD